jgi:hypothetical protein
VDFIYNQASFFILSISYLIFIKENSQSDVDDVQIRRNSRRRGPRTILASDEEDSDFNDDFSTTSEADDENPNSYGSRASGASKRVRRN